MQLRNVSIKNFKGIRDLTLNFTDEGEEAPRPITAIVGDNGAGKTSVLQAATQAS